MKVLFVCSANKQRSKTAEDYFAALYPEGEWESAGTNLELCRKEGTNELTLDVLRWAERVFVMEHRHQKDIARLFGSSFHSKIVVMNIPDRYKYMQRELIELLNQKKEQLFK